MKLLILVACILVSGCDFDPKPSSIAKKVYTGNKLFIYYNDGDSKELTVTNKHAEDLFPIEEYDPISISHFKNYEWWDKYKQVRNTRDDEFGAADYHEEYLGSGIEDMWPNYWFKFKLQNGTVILCKEFLKPVCGYSLIDCWNAKTLKAEDDLMCVTNCSKPTICKETRIKRGI